MNQKSIQKLTFAINTVIIFLVIGLMLFFYLCEATFLVYFSIPTLLVYLVGYVLIFRGKLFFYLCMVYFWLTLYMGISTICLGLDYGFCLYSLSMIPIINYTNYISYKLDQRKIPAGFISTMIVICFLASTIYIFVNGPIYNGPKSASIVFWFVNSITVISFLTVYTRIMINATIRSEEAMKRMSYVDQLTGLYNRRFMMEQLDVAGGIRNTAAVIMIDIDDFKKINDVYGHNAGDYVLTELADVMCDLCNDIVISRWGGEEFLLLAKDLPDVRDRMEKLRQSVAAHDFTFERQRINVTITIGYAQKEDTQSIDRWIQRADEKLYYGKNNGKNMVVG